MNATSGRVKSPYLEGNFGPVREEVASDQLQVIGELPTDMSGMFVRTGPNPQFEVRNTYHWFGGDGMLHGVRVANGKATYRNRFVRTKAYEREREAGAAIWNSGLGAPEIDNPNGPARGNTANTAMVWHDGRLLALWEGGDPYEIKLPGLETIGPYNYGGKLLHAFTAHPKVDERTGEMLFFGYNSMGMDMSKGAKVPFLQYSVASKAGEIVHSTPIDLPTGVMMHDFAVTERYSIFMNLPYCFSLERAMKGEDAFKFEPERGSHFGILPRHATQDRIKWFEAPPCYVFHTLNAFEEGDEVVLDACRMNSVSLDGIDSNKAIGPETPRMVNKDAQQHLHRWRFNMVTGAVKEETLDDAASDFPRVNDSLVGYKAQFGYTARFGSDDGMPKADAIIKYDLATGKNVAHDHGKGRFSGEGVFVPRLGTTAEDDGWIVCYVFDEGTGGSEFVVINAQDFAAPPVARVSLPQRVPYGFHGAWIGDEMMSTQR